MDRVGGVCLSHPDEGLPTRGSNNLHAGRRVNINRSLSLVVFVSVIDPSTAIDAILALALGGSVLVGGIAKS